MELMIYHLRPISSTNHWRLFFLCIVCTITHHIAVDKRVYVLKTNFVRRFNTLVLSYPIYSNVFSHPG